MIYLYIAMFFIWTALVWIAATGAERIRRDTEIIFQKTELDRIAGRAKTDHVYERRLFAGAGGYVQFTINQN